MANVEQLVMKIENLETKIAELETKIREVDDVKEIEKLQGIYGYYLDNRLMQEVVDLFSDDAESLEVANRGVFLGKEGAARFFLHAQGQPAPGWIMGRHLQLQGVAVPHYRRCRQAILRHGGPAYGHSGADCRQGRV